MSSISSFLDSVSELEWSVAVCVVVIPVLFLFFWRLISRSFYFADWWARNVKIRKWKKIRPGNLEQCPNGKVSLSAPEEELCKYYKRFVRATDEYTFKNAQQWLKLSGQADRKPMGFLVLLLLFSLTVCEALGTGLLIAPIVSTEMTGSMVLPVGMGIAIAVALVLLCLTHFAGAEAAFADVTKSNIGTSSSSERFQQKKIAPGDDYRIDDGINEKYRFVNRALNGEFKRPAFILRFLAFCFLSLIMVVIFYQRFEQQKVVYLNNLQDLPSSSSVCGSGAGGGNSSNPFAGMSNTGSNNVPGFSASTESPPSVACNSATVQDNISKESLFASERGADVGCFLLAFFYALTQFLGFFFAKKYSFFASGKEAYKITGGYVSYDKLKSDRLDDVCERAENALQILRNHLNMGFQEYEKYPSTMTFNDYVDGSKYSKATSEKYGQWLKYSDENIEILRGVEALEAAIDYRNELRANIKSMENLDEYPASLRKYVGYKEVFEHNRDKDSESMRIGVVQIKAVQESGLEQPVPKPVEAQATQQPSLASGKQAILAQYNVFDVEAAEEMLKAGSLKERKQILEELSEGSEEKKALIQEIYSKMKAV